MIHQIYSYQLSAIYKIKSNRLKHIDILIFHEPFYLFYGTYVRIFDLYNGYYMN